MLLETHRFRLLGLLPLALLACSGEAASSAPSTDTPADDPGLPVPPPDGTVSAPAEAGPRVLAAVAGVMQLAVAGDRIFVVSGGSGAPSHLFTMRTDGSELKELPGLTCKSLIGGRTEALCAQGRTVTILPADGASYATSGTSYDYNYDVESLGAFFVARNEDEGFVGTWDSKRSSTVFSLARGARGTLEAKRYLSVGVGCRGIAVDPDNVFSLRHEAASQYGDAGTKLYATARAGGGGRTIAEVGKEAYSLAVTSKNLFWWDAATRTLMTIGKVGDTQARAVQPSESTVQSNGDRAYWTGDGLFRAEADGTRVTRLADEASPVSPTFDDHYVYYASGKAVLRVAK
jgi:hypothetical protein